MSRPKRRTFVLHLATGSVAMLGATVGHRAFAQTPQAPVSETDPQAVALGYRAEASKVDTNKYPTYKSGQSCSGCALYQGKPAELQAPCAIFANKTVLGKGWCSAWNKRT